MSYDQAIRLYGSDKPDMRLPAMTDVRDSFQPRKISQHSAVNPTFAGGRDSHSEGRRAFQQRARRHQAAVQRARRSEVIRGFQAAGEDLSRSCCTRFAQKSQAEADDLIVLVAGDGKPGGTQIRRRREARGKAARPCCLYRRWPAAVGAGAEICRPAWRFQARLETQRKISASCGSLIFPCSSGTKRASAGPRRIIRSRRRTRRTWTSWNPIPAAVRALAYDVVLNGTELGSGSIRIHRQDIQRKIFQRARHDAKKKRAPASDSSSKPWNTGLLRMEALRWASIAL